MSIVDDLERRVAHMERDLEEMRIQLAGCRIAAEGGITNPAKPSDYGWSPAYAAVLTLRVEYEKLLRS